MTAAQAQQLGLLVNVHAGSVRRDPRLVAKLEALLPRGHVMATARVEDVAPALKALRERGVSAVGLVGGDGTLSGTLTELVETWPRPWPAVLVLRGGTVNTISAALGARGSPAASLRRWLHGDTHPRETVREVLRVEAEHCAPRCGLIFGNGVATRWLQAYYAEPEPGVQAASRVLARAVRSAAVGGDFARGLFESFTARVSIDGQAIPERSFRLIGASTIRDVGLGFRPFLSAGSAPGRFHLLHTDAAPARFTLDLPWYWLGREPPSSAVSHHNAARVEILLLRPEPWMIDADVQPPARRLVITTTEPLRFLGL
jgi:diacylglycerol kinase family enzyme